jgi:hypothetical protein
VGGSPIVATLTTPLAKLGVDMAGSKNKEAASKVRLSMTFPLLNPQ